MDVILGGTEQKKILFTTDPLVIPRNIFKLSYADNGQKKLCGYLDGNSALEWGQK